ncbi:MAG TPA: ABC transporter permease [Gemmatimonadaceae bacterium]|nr:ABC transporter permease [Gemmatimonadaceae bacterium]
MLANVWSDLRYRLRAIVLRSTAERELDAELRFHIERETEKLERAGVARNEALRLARVSFGGLSRIKDDARDARGVALVDATMQDLRYAFRGLRRSPGFTLAVVGTLALGIGANTAIFNVVDGLLFRTPPYLIAPSSVNHLYLAYDTRGDHAIDDSFEYRRYQDFRRWTSSFSHMAAYSLAMIAVGSGQDAVEVPVGRASASLFDFFDARPVLGRFFTPQEDSLPAGSMVAVLGYGFWQTRFGGRRDVLGQRIQISSGEFTIVGVAPEGFAGASGDVPAAAWIPVTAYGALQRPTFYQNYNWGWLQVIAQRKPGVGETAAIADLTHAYRLSWDAQRALESGIDPVDRAHPHVLIGPTQLFRGPMAPSWVRVTLWVFGVALMALVVACANVANLLLARGFGRRREIAVRRALGVGRGRLFRQLLTESLILAAAGGVAGFLFARLIESSLIGMVGGSVGAGADCVDPRLILFCAALTLLVGVATGLAPALHSGGDLNGLLRAGSREGSYQRSKLRGSLVVLQAAVSTTLLIGAGLFVRSLNHVRAVPLGYDVDPILIVQRNMRGVKLGPAQERELMERLESAAARVPGVVRATQMMSAPFYDFENTGLFVPGIDSVRKLGRFQLQVTSPSFFATVGTHIVAGRGLTADDREGTQPVVVVSAEMARRLWPGKSALGQCLRVGAEDAPCSTVVGIAEDTRQRGLSSAPDPTYYLAAAQQSLTEKRPRIPFGLFVRVSGHAADYSDRVRRALQAEMPGASYLTTVPFADIVGGVQESWRVGATMFAALGGLALVLAAVGLYSVIAYGVAQRSHELGVRIALGAHASRLVRLIMRDGVRLAAAGVVIGAAIALASGRWIAPLLFEERPSDPAVYATVAFTLVGVALAASLVPALRAARVDPNVALRSD